MKRLLAVGSLAFLVVSLVATPAAAGEKYKKVKGHVIKVEQHVRTQNGGESDRLTIRTRQGEEMQLHLGEGGACEGCFQEGDLVRARVRASEGAGSGHEVKSMKVRRGGEMAVCFAPPVEQIYPPGDGTRVLLGGLTGKLCGATRPGHFDGVADVLAAPAGGVVVAAAAVAAVASRRFASDQQRAAPRRRPFRCAAESEERARDGRMTTG